MSTSWPELTPDQAKTLAAFLNSLRRDWDQPGIFSQLREARERASAPDLAIAAIRAAANANNRSPAVIKLDGEHWRTASIAPTSRRPVDPSELCRICGKAEALCRQVQDAVGHDHGFEPAGVAGYVDTTTGEIAPPVDHSHHRQQLREAMAGALAMPE